MGEIIGVLHKIHLTNKTPIASKLYKIPFGKEKEIRNKIKRLENKGLIKPSTLAHATSAFVIPKKLGKIRLVINYRKLNQKPIKETYPNPIIEDKLIKLNGATIFSQLD